MPVKRPKWTTGRTLGMSQRRNVLTNPHLFAYHNQTVLTLMESLMVAFRLAATAAMWKLRAVNWPIAVSGPLV